MEYLIENYLDIVGTILGLLYLWLEMKEKPLMWVVGCIMPLIYTVVLYRAGIYADCAMEFYYFGAGVYGLLYWLRGKTKTGKSIAISHTPHKVMLRIACVVVILWLIMAQILIHLTDSNVPYIDAFTTSMSIVAMWMLSRKYIEQWWFWLIVDLISTGLYIYKGVYGRALLYGIYTLMAFYGYFVWKRRMTLAQTGGNTVEKP